MERKWGAVGGEGERGGSTSPTASQAKASGPKDHTSGTGEALGSTQTKGTGRGQGIGCVRTRVEGSLYVCTLLLFGRHALLYCWISDRLGTFIL